MPLELRASLSRTGSDLRADPLRLSLAGALVNGALTLATAAPVPRLAGELSAGDLDVAKLFPGRGTAARTG
jgi:hypothetical protein